MSRLDIYIHDALEPTSESRIKEIETQFTQSIRDWVLNRIDEKRGARNWASLPTGFESDAVRSLVRALKDHFPKNAVTLKVAAGRASTFNELRDAVMRVRVRNE